MGISVVHRDKEKTFKDGNRFLNVGGGWLKFDNGDRHSGSIKLDDTVQLVIKGKPVNMDDFFLNFTWWPGTAAEHLSGEDSNDDF